MEFEYDDNKSQQCLDERNFDFDRASRVFSDAVDCEIEDERHDYGETRYIKTGMVEGDIITVVWTPRNGKIRIITAWPASRQERKRYADAQI